MSPGANPISRLNRTPPVNATLEVSILFAFLVATSVEKDASLHLSMPTFSRVPQMSL
jgi:hypothetical protein